MVLRPDLLVDLRDLYSTGLHADTTVSPSSRSCHALYLASSSPFLHTLLTSHALSEEDPASLVLADAAPGLVPRLLDAVYGLSSPSQWLSDRDLLSWMSILQIGPTLLASEALEATLDMSDPQDLLSSLLPDPDATLTLSPMLQDLDTEDLTASAKFRHEKISRPPAFACIIDECSKRFPSRLRLELHMQQVHGVQREHLDLTCDICEKYTAKTRDALEVHKRNHLGSKPFQCSYCDKSFASESYLEQHLHSHNSKKIHECPVCFKTFQSMPSLSQHKQTHEMDGRKFCDACGKSFKTRRYLYQHMQRKHNTSMLHQCNICQKVLSGRDELTSHMRIHSGERPFVCSICKKSFSFRSSLHSHMKLHTNHRKHACEMCPKTFLRQFDLTKHARTHTNEKPYECETCGKAFARSDYRRKHMRIHNRKNVATETSVVLERAAAVEEEEDITNALLGGDEMLSHGVTLEAFTPVELVLDGGELSAPTVLRLPNTT